MTRLDPEREYARLHPQLEALCAGQTLLPINVDIVTVTVSVLGALPRVRSLQSQLRATLPDLDRELFGRIESYTAALLQAQARYRAAPARREPPRQLAAEVAALRRPLRSVTRMLVVNGVLDGAPLAQVGRRRGYLGVASDVLLLSTLLERHWAALAGKTPLTLPGLQQARLQSVRLLEAIGERRRAPEDFLAAALVRQQLFTLLVRSYDDLRRAVRYLRRRERDVDSWLPSLYGGRRRHRHCQSEAGAGPSRPQRRSPRPRAQPASALPVLPSVDDTRGCDAHGAVAVLRERAGYLRQCRLRRVRRAPASAAARRATLANLQRSAGSCFAVHECGRAGGGRRAPRRVRRRQASAPRIASPGRPRQSAARGPRLSRCAARRSLVAGAGLSPEKLPDAAAIPPRRTSVRSRGDRSPAEEATRHSPAAPPPGTR